MSTPIEIFDTVTGDSIEIDEYGLISIQVKANPDDAVVQKYAEFTLESALEIIYTLAYMVKDLKEKKKRGAERENA